MITFHPTLLQGLTLLVSVILPIVVGLVTTKVTSSNAKALLLLVLALVTSVVSNWIAAVQSGTAFDLWNALFTFGSVFLIGVATHYGLWKPTGTAAAAQSILIKSPATTADPAVITSGPFAGALQVSADPVISADPVTAPDAAQPADEPKHLAE